MSRRFAAASAQWFGATITPPAYPFTMASWFWANSSAAQTVMAFAKSTDSGNYHVLLLSGGNMLAQSQDGGGADNASLPFPYIGSWQLVAGVWASATSRQLFVGKRYSAGNASSITPTGLTELNIGNLSSYGIFADGLLAYPTVWDAALSMAEILAMAGGKSPELIRPQNLWAYGGFDELKASAPIMRSRRRAPIVLTDNNSVGVVSNDPPVRPERGRRLYFVSAPAGGATITLGQGSWVWTGRAMTVNSKSQVALAQGSWMWTGLALSINAKSMIALAQASWVWTGQALNINAKSMIALAQASWVWTGRALNISSSGLITLGQALWTWIGQGLNINAKRLIALGLAAWAWNGFPLPGFGSLAIYVARLLMMGFG